LKFKFSFQPTMTWLSSDSCTRVLEHIKDILQPSSHRQRDMHNKSCYDVCTPRVLCKLLSIHPSVNWWTLQIYNNKKGYCGVSHG